MKDIKSLSRKSKNIKEFSKLYLKRLNEIFKTEKKSTNITLQNCLPPFLNNFIT